MRCFDDKDTQRQMSKFYDKYPTMAGFENADAIDLYVMREYKKMKDKGFITEEEYNEKIKDIKVSLSKNAPFIKGLFQQEVSHISEEYPASVAAYNRIVDSTAQLCRELNLKDSMDIFVVFNYLLWNGFFSKNKSYIHTGQGRKNLMGYFGIDIINGQGVCLNNSHMLECLLKIMEYDSYMIANKTSKKIKANYKPAIERRHQKQKFTGIDLFLLEPITYFIGNHACTLVKKDDTYYVYDPTNLCVFKLDSFMRASMIGGTGDIQIKPYFLSLVSSLSNQKIVDIVDSYKKVESEKNPYDEEKIITAFETNLELCRNSIGLFNDFYIENESNRRLVLELFNKKTRS